MATQYETGPLPFRYRRLQAGNILAVSNSGDHAFLSEEELHSLLEAPHRLPIKRLAELKSKFFLGGAVGAGITRLLASRVAARKETVLTGPSLHIIVPTLTCAHSCKYCQVSRSLEDIGFTMSIPDLNMACDTIFQSPARSLTVEFQGGDPLLRFDLIRHAIDRIREKNLNEKRRIRFVVASTLHQLDGAMCAFFKEHGVYLSTSIDGPRELHNRNRPLPTRNSYERTVAGIELSRRAISPHSVSALMTTTRESLRLAEEIVDEYVDLGLNEIFVRPLSPYGFAKRNECVLGYSLKDFHEFYSRALDRVLYWNRQGVEIREVAACIALNKILSPFDAGYVDLQSPTGAGLATLVYNYDGHVYPSDEARMLAESGDVSLRLGRIGEPLSELLGSEIQRELIRASRAELTPGCSNCAYNTFCGPDPVSAHAQWGGCTTPVELTDHCQHYLWLFDYMFDRLSKDADFEGLAYQWAQPVSTSSETVNA